jgi:tetratricopeptide (TPR) repeat protein
MVTETESWNRNVWKPTALISISMKRDAGTVIWKSVGAVSAPDWMVMPLPSRVRAPPRSPTSPVVTSDWLVGHSTNVGELDDELDELSGAVARGSPHDNRIKSAEIATPIAPAPFNFAALMILPAYREGPASIEGAPPTHGATDVPESNDLMEEGAAAEKLGLLDRAESCYAAAASSGDSRLRARALTKLADVHRCRSEWDVALDFARRARDAARETDEGELVGDAMVAEANVLTCRGDFDGATALLEQLLTATTEPRLRGVVLQNLGSILAQKGQLGAAERAYGESYGFFRKAGYRRGEAIALNNYGRVALDRGDVALAERSLEDALAVAREVEDTELTAIATLNLAEALAKRAQCKRARDLASAAFGYFGESGNRWRQVECLRLLGTLHESERCYDDAERCLGRGLALAEQIGARAEITTLRDALARVRFAARAKR